MRKPSFVFIGLDAAGPDLLRDWMNSGDLPNLGLLRKSALWGNALAEPGFGQSVVWNSLMTGVHLGRYGVYFNWQLKPGTYSLYRINEDHDLKARQFWEFFSEAGLSCAVIDLVRAGLSPNLNGIQVADWLSHDPILAARSTPQNLIAEMTAHYGKDPFVPLTTTLQADGVVRACMERPDPEPFLEAALKRIEAKTHFLERLVSEGRFDVIMAAYSDAHDIGHYAWHLHDRGHPEFDETMSERLGDPLKETYRALDQSIGRLMARLPAETTVMIFGGPGMAPSYTGRHLLRRVLDRLEFGRPHGIPAFREQVKDIYRLVAPDSVQRFIRTKRRGARPKTPRVDQWANRLCFMLPHSDTKDLIRINLEGREPRGRVKRADFDAFRARLARDLLELVDPATGTPAVKNVVDVVTAYPQPNTEELPDLSVEWSTERPIRAVSSPKIGVVHGGFFAPTRTGDHGPDCFFFVRAPGARPRELKTPATYLDIAATIPRLVGVDIPGLDGRPVALE